MKGSFSFKFKVHMIPSVYVHMLWGNPTVVKSCEYKDVRWIKVEQRSNVIVGSCDSYVTYKTAISFMVIRSAQIPSAKFSYTTIDFVAFIINIHSIAPTAVVRSEIRIWKPNNVAHLNSFMIVVFTFQIVVRKQQWSQ